MFKIYDGRKELFQWDLDRQVIVSDASVNEVHFCNRTDGYALVVEVYELDGVRVADIPNILLQEPWPIRAYGHCGDCYTKDYTTLKVIARSKPADYIYTETEVKNYEDLNEHLAALEAKKVDKEDGKGLSTNDFTNDEKEFISLIMAASPYVDFGKADLMQLEDEAMTLVE